MPAIWNLHHEHCRIFQGHTFIGCVFSVGPRGFAPIGPSKFARGKGCKSHSLDWSEEKMKKAPCRFSKNPCWDTHTIIKVIPNERSRKLKIYEKDINEIWEGLIAYHSIVQKRCMAKLGGFASRKIMYVHRCDTTFTVAICAIWNCPIACVMICGSNGHAAEATNLWSQRIRKKKNLPECSPSVRVERRKEREFGRYHHLNLVDRSIWAKFMKQCQQCWEP